MSMNTLAAQIELSTLVRQAYAAGAAGDDEALTDLDAAVTELALKWGTR